MDGHRCLSGTERFAPGMPVSQKLGEPDRSQRDPGLAAEYLFCLFYPVG